MTSKNKDRNSKMILDIFSCADVIQTPKSIFVGVCRRLIKKNSFQLAKQEVALTPFETIFPPQCCYV